MASRGRPPKPTALHVADGTFRNKDHAGRAKEPKAKGIPQPPDWLDDVAREHWFAVVGPLVEMKVAKAIDTSALSMLCDAWSRWRSLRSLCGDEPALKAKYAYALSRLQKDWLDIGCRFAMTASDRTRIEVEGDTPTEAAERFVI